MAINQEQVSEACEELTAEGVKPTLAAVRELLGEGSYSTLGRMVQAWRTKGVAVAPTVAATQIPGTLQALGERFMQEVWALADRLASERLKSEREELAKEKAQMADELASAYAELEEQRLQVTLTEHHLEDEKIKVAHLKTEMSVIGGEMADLLIVVREAKAEAAAYRLAIEAFKPEGKAEAVPSKPAKKGKAGAPEVLDSTDTKTQPLGL